MRHSHLTLGVVVHGDVAVDVDVASTTTNTTIVVMMMV